MAKKNGTFFEEAILLKLHSVLVIRIYRVFQMLLLAENC